MNEYQSTDGYVKARGITANQKPLYRADVFNIIEAPFAESTLLVHFADFKAKSPKCFITTVYHR